MIVFGLGIILGSGATLLGVGMFALGWCCVFGR